MTIDFEPLESAFRRVRSSPGDAMVEFVELQRQELYDYILRLTGQAERASTTVDELARSMESIAKRLDNMSELRAKLFATARRFNADVWGADTSSLVNLAIESADSNFSSAPHAPVHMTFDQQLLLRLDHGLRSMGSRERELLWLIGVGRFETSEVAQIMDWPERQVAAALNDAWTLLSAQAQISIADLQASIQSLPRHPVPGDSQSTTVAISQMIGSLSETSRIRSRRLWRRIVMLALVGCLAYAAWMLYGRFKG